MVESPHGQLIASHHPKITCGHEIPQMPALECTSADKHYLIGKDTSCAIALLTCIHLPLPLLLPHSLHTCCSKCLRCKRFFPGKSRGEVDLAHFSDNSKTNSPCPYKHTYVRTYVRKYILCDLLSKNPLSWSISQFSFRILLMSCRSFSFS